MKAVSPKLALMYAAKESFRAFFKEWNTTEALFGLLDWMATAAYRFIGCRRIVKFEWALMPRPVAT